MSNFAKNRKWNDRELLDLATGLQKYGASETAKIAEFIVTKSEYQVVSYMLYKGDKMTKKYYEERNLRYPNYNKSHHGGLLPEEIVEWPTIRKWHQIARDQMAPSAQRLDYSKIVIRDLCKNFYEEAEETTNPQMVDVKAIYKFLLDSICGKNPAELMPKESGIVLMLLKKLKEIKNSLDMKEEQKFIQSYTKGTNFVPFKVKDEFGENENEDLGNDSDAVHIPEEVFNILHQHRKIVQSFNPLMVPLWLLDKEQTDISQMLQSTSEI